MGSHPQQRRGTGARLAGEAAGRSAPRASLVRHRQAVGAGRSGCRWHIRPAGAQRMSLESRPWQARRSVVESTQADFVCPADSGALPARPFRAGGNARRGFRVLSGGRRIGTAVRVGGHAGLLCSRGSGYAPRQRDPGPLASGLRKADVAESIAAGGKVFFQGAPVACVRRPGTLGPGGAPARCGSSGRPNEPKRIRAILEDSERQIRKLQEQTGYDLYWRLYFALT
jgi:hypothetical protein